MTVHKLPIRVYYEDTDAGSVVYHARYLVFAERARTEMLRDHGFEHAELLKKNGIAFAVRHIEIDYQKPAVLDDLLMVETWITRIGGASFDLQHRVLRDNTVIADIKVVLVCMILPHMTATRLPEDIRNLFQHLLPTGETVNV